MIKGRRRKKEFVFLEFLSANTGWNMCVCACVRVCVCVCKVKKLLNKKKKMKKQVTLHVVRYPVLSPLSLCLLIIITAKMDRLTQLQDAIDSVNTFQLFLHAHD